LPKPIQSKKFLEMIAYLLGVQPGQRADGKTKKIVTQHSIDEHLKHSVSILLAEDNPVNQKLAETMLKRAGYAVDLAANGREAVDTFIASPQKYDLIFMDIQMPEMDGITAVEQIRSRGYDKIPIVAMTANAMQGDRETCLDAGMNDYVSKPIKREVVFEAIRKWVLERPAGS